MADRGRRFARSTRRKTHWTEANGAAAITATGSNLLFSQGVGHEGETIARVRGLATLSLLTAAANGDGFFGAFGMAIVTAAAAAIGVTAIPTPLTEAGWDGWLLHQYLSVERITAGSDIGEGWSEYDRRVLDSKAMRKANEDEVLIGVWEGAETGISTGAIQVRVRVLSMIG